jgi:peptide/nickel transport system substrate-binding protein
VRRARALALAATAAVALPAVVAAGVRPTWGGTIRVGLATAPRPSDDAADPADLLLMRATSAALLEVDARGRLVPGALAEVPVQEAEGRAFRLRLRPGLVDAAGRPVGAIDLATRLTVLLQRSPPSPNAFVALPILGADAVLEGRARSLAGVAVLSPTELLVTLAFPLPQYPLLLAAAPAGLPGAGPFTLEGAPSPSAGFRLVRNDRHFAGRPFADALELHVREPRTSARLLETGELDLVLRPEPFGDRSRALPPLTATVAIVNAAKLGPAAEPLRAALAALDRAELAQRFVRGAAEPLDTIVPPSLLPRAAPAPVARGAGALPPRLVVVADASAADQRALAERVQVKLFDRGVRAGLELLDGAGRLRARLATADWDVALVSVTVLAPDPALAAGQIAWAARGAAAGRRVLAELAPVAPGELRAAADRLGKELGIVPLVATGLRASAGAALEDLPARPDGAIDTGRLWLLRGGVR